MLVRRAGQVGVPILVGHDRGHDPLVAERNHEALYKFDIRVQGDDEIVFFEY